MHLVPEVAPLGEHHGDTGSVARLDHLGVALRATRLDHPGRTDAFFPFADGPQAAIDIGATGVIQPGGSKRDAEVIEACDAAGVAMVFTKRRHFRH